MKWLSHEDRAEIIVRQFITHDNTLRTMRACDNMEIEIHFVKINLESRQSYVDVEVSPYFLIPPHTNVSIIFQSFISYHLESHQCWNRIRIYRDFQEFRKPKSIHQRLRERINLSIEWILFTCEGNFFSRTKFSVPDQYSTQLCGTTYLVTMTIHCVHHDGNDNKRLA